MGEVEQLADAIAAEAPRPSAAAAKQASAQADARDPRWAKLRDKQGHAFDPQIHQTSPDGSPKLSRAGRLQGLPGRPLPRKGGSRVEGPHAPVSSVPSLGEVAGAGEPSTGAGSAGSEISAQVVVDTTTNLCALALGPEWNPRKEKIGGRVFDERAQLIEALSRYFEATGVHDVPPGVLLGLTLGGYVLPRLGAPATRSRLVRAWERVRGWYRRLRGARPDPRDNGVRQDDAGQAPGRAA